MDAPNGRISESIQDRMFRSSVNHQLGRHYLPCRIDDLTSRYTCTNPKRTKEKKGERNLQVFHIAGNGQYKQQIMNTVQQHGIEIMHGKVKVGRIWKLDAIVKESKQYLIALIRVPK